MPAHGKRFDTAPCSGLGSRTAITTRFTLPPMIAIDAGRRLPRCAHGSRFEHERRPLGAALVPECHHLGVGLAESAWKSLAE